MTLPASPEAREANSRITENEQLRIKLRILENEMWLDEHGRSPQKNEPQKPGLWSEIAFWYAFILSCIPAIAIITAGIGLVYYIFTH